MNISNKVKARLTTFSEMESERICFVGDPEGFGENLSCLEVGCTCY